METQSQPIAGTYTIDAVHSQIGVTARHAMVTKVRGTFNEFEGVAVIGEKLADSRVSVTIKAASIDTRNADRDGHLRGDDFLAVETYPEITFVGTSVSRDGDDFVITGDLTIKDVTKPLAVTFEYQGTATDPFGNVRAGFEGSVTISRKEWGITWNAALETGGVLVSDKVNLEFEISAIKS